MKKIICLLIAAVLAAGILTACGDDAKSTKETEGTTTAAVGNETTATAAPQEGTEDAEAADQYTFVYKGTNISVKADAAPILEVLGEPKSYTEETSCAFDGLDKNYTFTSFILTTYPDGELDRVNSVTLLDDTVNTKDGICIGDSKEKVEEVYGAESFDGIHAYIMEEDGGDGDARLTIILDGDKVSSIQYTALFK